MVMRRRSGRDLRVLRRRARRVLSAIVKLRCQCSLSLPISLIPAGKPVGVFDASHVERMLRSGQWEDAYCYLERFVRRDPLRDASPLADRLLAYVGLFKTIAPVVAGGKEGAHVASLYADPSEDLVESPDSARLHKIIARLHKDRTRAAKLWQKLEPEGLRRIMDLVAKCPELQGEVRMPRKRPMLWDVPLHWQQLCPRRCKHTPSDVLIRTFLRKRLLTVQGKNYSARSRNAFSHSAVAHLKMEHITPQETIHEDADFLFMLQKPP